MELIFVVFMGSGCESWVASWNSGRCPRRRVFFLLTLNYNRRNVRMYMRLLWEPCGTWLSILVMRCAWWRRRESLHLYICARRRDLKWHDLWQLWLLHTCLMAGTGSTSILHQPIFRICPALWRLDVAVCSVAKATWAHEISRNILVHRAWEAKVEH